MSRWQEGSGLAEESLRPKSAEAAVGEAGSAALLPLAVEAPVVVAEMAAVVAVEDFAADVVAA